jgi:hypothetical protein
MSTTQDRGRTIDSSLSLVGKAPIYRRRTLLGDYIAAANTLTASFAVMFGGAEHYRIGQAHRGFFEPLPALATSV